MARPGRRSGVSGGRDSPKPLALSIAASILPANLPQGRALADRALRRDGRVAEGARLESVYTGNRIVGSNPTPSAKTPDFFSTIANTFWDVLGPRRIASDAAKI